MTIENVEQQDMGSYVCKATNSAGQDECKAQLKETGKCVLSWKKNPANPEHNTDDMTILCLRKPIQIVFHYSPDWLQQPKGLA